MKEVPANKKKSLGKLPTPVRNKMGYMEEGGEVKKKPKINISREEFENQTREERAAYNRMVKEMDRKIKEGYDKAKKRNFKEGGKVKKGSSRLSKIIRDLPKKSLGRILAKPVTSVLKKKKDKKIPKMGKMGAPAMSGYGSKKSMKHGGSVKGKCRMDGIAVRGKTRAKQRRS
tara:strand:+ start:48 stop:566 length:519 start_codon:yes stop_codon:yes gene_type:complete